MNKKLCVSAVSLVMASLMASVAHAAPTVYGKAFVTADYEDIERKARSVDPKMQVEGDKDSLQINSHGSRIGFKGAEPMTDNTDVIYQLEYSVDIDGDDSRTFRARDTYLGIDNKTFGEFRFGRLTAPSDNINNVIMNSGYWDNMGTPFNMVDSARLDNSVLWTAPKIEGIPLDFYAMYAADEDDADTDGWGASLMFDQNNGFTAGLAYEKDLSLPAYRHYVLAPGQNDSPQSNQDRLTRRNSLNTGKLIRGTMTFDLAKLTNNPGLPLTLGALYQQADFDYTGSKKEKAYIISALWSLQNFAKPADVYVQYNNTSDLRGLNGKDSDQIVVGGHYYYKPNIILHGYAGYNDSDIEFANGTVQLPNGKDYTGEFVIRDRRAGTETFTIGGGLEYKF
ncbi:porin [Psychrobacter lutiphocae]|uniref:porin n=1 Tax=Psychrobacter lutiphocae TaxID=540500 RepID=UPI0005269902|nr:porin [Psychrobacter lutiphocae]